MGAIVLNVHNKKNGSIILNALVLEKKPNDRNAVHQFMSGS
jgi:hypothetical protein